MHPAGRKCQLGRRCRNNSQRGGHPQHLGDNGCCRGNPAPARGMVCIERSLEPAVRKRGRQSACRAAQQIRYQVLPCSCRPEPNTARRLMPDAHHIPHLLDRPSSRPPGLADYALIPQADQTCRVPRLSTDINTSQ